MQGRAHPIGVGGSPLLFRLSQFTWGTAVHECPESVSGDIGDPDNKDLTYRPRPAGHIGR